MFKTGSTLKGLQRLWFYLVIPLLGFCSPRYVHFKTTAHLPLASVQGIIGKNDIRLESNRIDSNRTYAEGVW